MRPSPEMQAKERDARRVDYANRIRTHHQKLINKGDMPPDYILSAEDIAKAIDFDFKKKAVTA